MGIQTHDVEISTNNCNWVDDDFISPDIYLYTVPHTGTTFVMKYLHHIGFNSSLRTDDGKHKYYAIHSIPGYVEDNEICNRIVSKCPLENNKLLVTARHPHHCLMSHLARYENTHTHEEIFDMTCARWYHFLTTISNSMYMVFNLDMPQHNRHTDLTTLAYLLTGSSLAPDLESFTNEWKPENKFSKSRENPYMVKYAQDPSFINKFDLERLNAAVDWYEVVTSDP